MVLRCSGDVIPLWYATMALNQKNLVAGLDNYPNKAVPYRPDSGVSDLSRTRGRLGISCLFDLCGFRCSLLLGFHQ
jgi:hypothetical protein